MTESKLLTELKKNGANLTAVPFSYYAKGLNDPCLIEPENIIVFFSPQAPSVHSSKWSHFRYQIKCNLGNPAFIGLDGLKFKIPSQSGIVIFPFQVHFFDLTAPVEDRYYLTISFKDKGNGRNSLLPLLNRPFKIDEEDIPLLTNIVCAYQKLPGYSLADGVGSLRIFLSRKLLQCESENGGIPYNNSFISKLISYVRENSDHPLSIKDLAAFMDISESHLRLKVRQELEGISLGRFLLQLRFIRACELIECTDLSLQEIAEKCGYRTIYSFNRFFKNISGTPPAAFRKKMTNAQS